MATMGTASAIAFALILGFSTSLRVTAAFTSEPAVGFALPSRAVLLVGALAFLCMFAEGATADWAAVYLVTVAGTTTAMGALGFSSFALAMTVGRLTGDFAVHRVGAPRIVALGGALAAFGLGLTLIMPRFELALAGYALAGLGIANIVPVLFSAGGRSVPDHPAIGVAMAATCGYAGFLTSPPLIGALSNAFGLRIALVVLAIAMAAVALSARRVLGRTGPSLDRSSAATVE